MRINSVIAVSAVATPTAKRLTGPIIVINIPAANSCSPWINSHVQQINEKMTIYQCDGAKASE